VRKVTSTGEGGICVDGFDEVLTFTFLWYLVSVYGDNNECFINEYCIRQVLSNPTLFVIFITNVTYFHLRRWYRLL